ncbi:MAG: hypothetical protein M5U15_13665 [Kiritimatiellae bacterium]|nr:hypothetical protein [Kiritimatiellia bacterium]
MKSNSGEVITMVLVGLAIGSLASVIRANSWAQQQANMLGTAVPVRAYIAEKPVEALALPALGAAAGWGLSELTSNDGKSNDLQPIYVTSGRDTTLSISGRDGSTSNTQRQEDNR